MGKLTEFPLAEGGSVLIEVNAPAAVGGTVTRGLTSGQISGRAQKTFEDAVQRVEPAAEAIISRLRGMANRPDEIRVEFGVDLHAEAGAFIAAASTTANFKIALTWRAS